MTAHDLAGEIQTQAGAPNVAVLRRDDAPEPAKQQALVSAADADTVVADAHKREVIFDRPRDLDFSPGW